MKLSTYSQKIIFWRVFHPDWTNALRILIWWIKISWRHIILICPQSIYFWHLFIFAWEAFWYAAPTKLKTAPNNIHILILFKFLKKWNTVLNFFRFMYTVNKNITRVWGRGCCRQIMMCSDSFMSIFLHCFLYCLLKKSCKNTYNFLGKKNTRPRFQNYIDILFEARRVKNNPKSNFTIDFTL